MNDPISPQHLEVKSVASGACRVSFDLESSDKIMYRDSCYRVITYSNL